jgi:hypothetical protein
VQLDSGFHRTRIGKTIDWASRENNTGTSVARTVRENQIPATLAKWSESCSLEPSTSAHQLRIPRGFAFVGDDLYIANAWRKDSHIARYRRHGDTFQFAELIVTTEQIPAMAS